MTTYVWISHVMATFAIRRSPPTPCSDNRDPASPCGICRQVLREFCSLDTPVLLVPGDYPAEKNETEQGGVIEETVGGLLPRSFGPEDLGKIHVSK